MQSWIQSSYDSVKKSLFHLFLDTCGKRPGPFNNLKKHHPKSSVDSSWNNPAMECGCTVPYIRPSYCTWDHTWGYSNDLIVNNQWSTALILIRVPVIWSKFEFKIEIHLSPKQIPCPSLENEHKCWSSIQSPSCHRQLALVSVLVPIHNNSLKK